MQTISYVFNNEQPSKSIKAAAATTTTTTKSQPQQDHEIVPKKLHKSSLCSRCAYDGAMHIASTKGESMVSSIDDTQT
jgi:hypothetical protein